MNLNEIKKAVRAGKKVHWANEAYIVVMTEIGRNCTEQWLIKCVLNDSCIGLTWTDGITLNGKEEDFYTIEEPTEEDNREDDLWHDQWESHEFGAN